MPLDELKEKLRIYEDSVSQTLHNHQKEKKDILKQLLALVLGVIAIISLAASIIYVTFFIK